MVHPALSAVLPLFPTTICLMQMPYEHHIGVGKETQRQLWLAQDHIFMEAVMMLKAGVGCGTASLAGMVGRAEAYAWAKGVRRAVSYADTLYPAQ